MEYRYNDYLISMPTIIMSEKTQMRAKHKTMSTKFDKALYSRLNVIKFAL